MAKVSTNSIRITKNFQETFYNVVEISVMNYGLQTILVNHKDVVFEVPGASIVNSVYVPIAPFVINALGNEINEVKLEITFPDSVGNAVINSSQIIKC